jgi:glycosyltransferase involved in cell wall biosynthesis
VALEAMALERAVVVSATPSKVEVVTQGQTGLVYPVGDVEAATETVSRLLASPAWRRSLGFAAREHVRRQFDATVTVGRLAQLLRDAAAARGSADASRPLKLAGAGSRA